MNQCKFDVSLLLLANVEDEADRLVFLSITDSGRILLQELEECGSTPEPDGLALRSDVSQRLVQHR